MVDFSVDETEWKQAKHMHFFTFALSRFISRDKMWIISEKWGLVIALLNEICWVVFSDKRKVSQMFIKAQATKNIIYYFHQEQCITPF